MERPKLKLSEVENYFVSLINGGMNAKGKSRVLKYSKAALWFLDQGIVRVWDRDKEEVCLWVKTAILEYFRASNSSAMKSGMFEYFDKLPVKSRTSLKGVRVVPGAVARFGSFIESGAILMPSFINIGAFVGKDSMIDTWATVGSCAQIGERVHLSGGVGIGGVLEPAQAAPVIIEDGAFLGSRVVVVEGVRVGKEAVLGAGVVLTSSTKIVDVRDSSSKIFSGQIPARSVVIPGMINKQFKAGDFGVPCALIIGTRSESTDLKTSLNAVLREHSISV